MARPLSAAQRAELDRLAAEYGEPLRVEAEIFPGFDDPIRKPDRVGEVCMVIRRPNGRLLLSIKTIYPRGAHRLPTGGIKRSEGILAALRRETHEETGLDVVVRRFLANISYRVTGERAVIFRTFAFLLDETGGTLGVLDPAEQIEEYIEVPVDGLPAVADRLEALAGSRGTAAVAGSWGDWGRFRAVVHRAVHQALGGAART